MEKGAPNERATTLACCQDSSGTTHTGQAHWGPARGSRAMSLPGLPSSEVPVWGGNSEALRSSPLPARGLPTHRWPLASLSSRKQRPHRGQWPRGLPWPRTSDGAGSQRPQLPSGQLRDRWCVGGGGRWAGLAWTPAEDALLPHPAFPCQRQGQALVEKPSPLFRVSTHRCYKTTSERSDYKQPWK